MFVSAVAVAVAWLAGRALHAVHTPADAAAHVLLLVGAFVLARLPLRALAALRAGRTREVYSLSHVLLNLTDPGTLWNNMGLWRDVAPDDFPAAATALAARLALAAALGPADRLLDIGVGCGDQTLLYAPQVAAYTGVTSLDAQAAVAARRCKGLAHAALYTLDASRPQSWPAAALERAADCNKIVALDCLYHLAPDRREFLTYAHSLLAAGGAFAAADLVRGDSPSFLQQLGLRVVCAFAHTPVANFVTVADYVRLLESCGFTAAAGWTVSVEDVSADVFDGLARFIKRRDASLGAHLQFKPYSSFAKVLAWWARSGVVRSVVVTVRK
ncbi:S-adenosyl-L-methionine-dependent methyltransferase [Dipodascopsis tothii]|uniref:S-adenosyl-L-methionine-dependent methyltransferase n=1 Tax=Dipodascopsis tothii TaxID=44089 RepID=UPI0034CE6593